MKKLRCAAGETLVEALVSVLIAALAFTFLSTAAVAAARINEKARTDVSFHYFQNATEGAAATVQVSGSKGTRDESVVLYENNGYYYYTRR